MSILGIVCKELKKFKTDMGKKERNLDVFEQRKCGESCIKERLVGLCNANNYRKGLGELAIKECGSKVSSFQITPLALVGGWGLHQEIVRGHLFKIFFYF